MRASVCLARTCFAFTRTLTATFLLGFFFSSSQAQGTQPKFETWLADFQEEARRDGISDETLKIALAGIDPLERVIELDRRQPEFTRTFWSYIGNRVTSSTVARGRKMMTKYDSLLSRIAQQYGVPKRYLVAFWGMETNFGAHLGSFPVIEALATLAHDPRRSEFFRTQLLHALHIVDEDHIAPKAMKGSWAGAMGHMQFLPSTFVRHAVDASGDDRKDIWGNLPDALASGANYLSNMGWETDQRWGREVRLPTDFDWSQARLEIKKTVAAWSKIGVKRADGRPLPRIVDMKGAILLPQGHDGPAFLVYENFRTILRWNRSLNYAISVGHLADRLIGLPKLQTGQDVANEPLSRRLAKELQRRLNELGFEAGNVDGLPGPQTRAAIRRFQMAAGHPADGYPSSKLLDQINAYARQQESG